MKKFIIGATAALIAISSLATTAEAGWKWKYKHKHWHHKHHHHKIWIHGHRRHDYCFIKKVRRYDDWGNMYIKRVRVCPW